MCTHAQTNLGLDEPSSNKKKDSTYVEILKLAWLPTAGMFFNPIPLLINIAFIGRMGDI